MRFFTLAVLLVACGNDDGDKAHSHSGHDMPMTTTTATASGTTGNATSTGPTASTSGGSTTAGPTTSGGPTSGGTTGGTAPLSYAVDVEPIFQASCGPTCHLNGSASGTLTLEPNGYANLVGTPSFQASGVQRVAPGDAPNSYLFAKLANTHVTLGGSGSRMPLGGTLSAADLSTVEAWINNGANP